MTLTRNFILISSVLGLSGCSSSDIAAGSSSSGEAYVIRKTDELNQTGQAGSDDEARKMAERDAVIYNLSNSRSSL